MTSYYGYYKHTAATGAKRKYDVDKLQKLAAHVVAYHSRKDARKRKERQSRYGSKMHNE